MVEAYEAGDEQTLRALDAPTQLASMHLGAIAWAENIAAVID